MSGKFIVGFTGTGEGKYIVSSRQEHLARYLKFLYEEANYGEFHHGDCVGADEIAHGIADELGYRIIIHPPQISIKRAFCAGRDVYTRQTRPYLKRNWNIAQACTILIAMPKEIDREELRSGTWSTVRYARKLNKPVEFV